MLPEPDPKEQSPLTGRWTYRSFMGDPDIDKDFGDLEFGRGELLVEYVCQGFFIGRLLFGETYQFHLEGVATPGDPPAFAFRGIGDAPESQGQTYEYFGCLMPLWPHDRKQRPTIVGTVIRAAPAGDETPGPSTPDESTPGPSTPDESTPDESTPDSSTPNPSTPDQPETGHPHSEQHPYRRP
ncbi:MAG: hypothetical protein LC808_07240 [Actinobacteria bacterium]|nr:hypothetical protein [Actinomycetota bacterium]